MGKRNKVLKLTKKKIDYIIRAKTRNDSNKNIAVDMKISKSTVKRVWTHWLIHKAPIPIKKFGRKKQVTDEKSVELIIQVQKEQKLGARRLERIINFKHKRHIPHNRIHDALLENGLAKRNKNKSGRRKA
jgi:transposase